MNFRCAYCGAEHYAPLPYLLLKYLIRKKYYYFVCQNCLHYNARLLIFRTVHDSLNEKEKESNKSLKRWF